MLRAVVNPPPTKPQARSVLRRGGPAVETFEVELQVVTPILGGGTRTRELDEIDVIRIPSVRGQLRFWWRALWRGGESGSDVALLVKREREVWGLAADDHGGRSRVEVGVNVRRRGDRDIENVQMGDDGAYALWPARATSQGEEPAPRRKPGTAFTLRVRCEQDVVAEVKNAVRAWILFGGYGGRVRRGLGSLSAKPSPGDTTKWLPSTIDRKKTGLVEVFGHDPLSALDGWNASDRAVLHGARLFIGRPVGDGKDAVKAWLAALEVLREFRQGVGLARERGSTPNRPGRSRWPEADKLRHLSGPGPWPHTPRHDAQPAWPRAAFGLPIVGKFNVAGEAPPFELVWKDGKLVHDRLASPLIVKALPLADGSFVPGVLWLNRADPRGGEVVLKAGKKKFKPGSEAPFDRLVGSTDSILVAPLATPAVKAAPAGTQVKTAFLDWLKGKGWTEVTGG